MSISTDSAPEEQTAELWQLLAQADALPVPGDAGQPVGLNLPELAKAQLRWREAIGYFNSLA